MAMTSQKYCQNLPLQTDITRKWKISSFGLEKKWLILPQHPWVVRTWKISTLAMM
jgi:hypothetical protein